MLTKNDKTIDDCLEKVELAGEVGISHIGFKDIGVDAGTLGILNRKIKDLGAKSYLEVVSTSKTEERKSIELAKNIGVDRVCGGKEIQFAANLLRDSQLEYLPFVGIPFSHPTKLRGSPKEIFQECKEIVSENCFGVDLLAYRSTESEPVELVKCAKKALENAYLLVAGDIDNEKKIEQIFSAGADGFTMGSAIFNGSYPSNDDKIQSRLEEVQKKVHQLNYNKYDL